MLKPLAALFSLALVVTACARETAPPAPESAAQTPAAVPPPAVAGDIAFDDGATIEDLAADVLVAWRARDVSRLAGLGPPGATTRLIFLEPDSEHWRAAFGDDTWYMKAVSAWDGRILGVERGLDAAWVIFHEEPAWRYAVEVHRFGDRWGLHHLRQLPRPDRRGLTVIPPLPPPPPLAPPLAAHP
jgi:hypothetical protein